MFENWNFDVGSWFGGGDDLSSISLDNITDTPDIFELGVDAAINFDPFSAVSAVGPPTLALDGSANSGFFSSFTNTDTFKNLLGMIGNNAVAAVSSKINSSLGNQQTATAAKSSVNSTNKNMSVASMVSSGGVGLLIVAAVILFLIFGKK